MFTRLREDIAVVFDRDPAARNAWEVVTCYPGLHAISLHRLSHRLWGAGFKWLARFLSHLGRWLTGIEIHPGAQIGRRFFIDHGMGVVIGETSEIGDDCTLYHGVTLGGTRPSADQAGKKRHPTLGDDVIVGSGAQVLGPITVGDHARIGAAAVVLQNVPDGATMVGNPARRVARRGAAAEQPCFEPYGVTGDIPDPIARALNGLLDEVSSLRARLDAAEGALAERTPGPLPLSVEDAVAEADCGRPS
jgi:serine O-acetyltransferase